VLNITTLSIASVLLKRGLGFQTSVGIPSISQTSRTLGFRKLFTNCSTFLTLFGSTLLELLFKGVSGCYQHYQMLSDSFILGLHRIRGYISSSPVHRAPSHGTSQYVKPLIYQINHRHRISVHCKSAILTDKDSFSEFSIQALALRTSF